MTKTLNTSIYKLVLENKSVSIDLAMELGIKQISVEHLARRKSSKLLNINAIDVFKNHGLSESEIFNQK